MSGPLRSQNGWTVLEDPPPLVELPGTGVRLRIRPGDVAVVLAELGRRFHAEVEPLDLAVMVAPGRDDWGWAYRPVRGQETGFSNHASGTAIDLNATRHPRGVAGTFTATQERVVRRILADLDGVVRWGEDYRTTVDGMHFEIAADADDVARVAARIRNQEDDDMQAGDTVRLGPGSAKVLGQADGVMTYEESIATSTAAAVETNKLLREVLAELRALRGS